MVRGVYIGAVERTRTSTGLPLLRPERSASTNSATTAGVRLPIVEGFAVFSMCCIARRAEVFVWLRLQSVYNRCLVNR